MERVIIDKSGTVLEIEVKTNVSKAIKDIDKLFRSLKKLEKIDVSNIKMLNKMDSSNLIKLEKRIQSLSSGISNLQKMNTSVLDSTLQHVNIFTQHISEALFAIFGWEFKSDNTGVVLNDWSNSAQNVVKSTGIATKNIAKMSRGIRAFDELNNIITPREYSGAGGGNNVNLVQIDIVWNDYKGDINTLYNFGDYVEKILTESVNQIDWDNIYKGAINFGIEFSDFLKDLISIDLFGSLETVITNTLKNVFNSALSFNPTFNLQNFGDLNINGSVDFNVEFNFGDITNTINTWVEQIWETIKNSFKSLNVFGELGILMVNTLNAILNSQLTFTPTFNLQNFGDLNINGSVDFNVEFNFGDITNTINTWVEQIWETIKNSFKSLNVFGQLGILMVNTLNAILNSELTFTPTFNLENFGDLNINGNADFNIEFNFGDITNTINTWVEQVWTTIRQAINSMEWSIIWEDVKELIGDINITGLEITIEDLSLLKVESTSSKFDFVEFISSNLSDFLKYVPVDVGSMNVSSFGSAVALDSSVATTFGAAATPILAVVIAIAALAIGLGYVFTKSEEVRESFNQAISAIREGLQPALEFLTETLLPDLKAGWDRILEVLTPLGEFLEEMFTSIWMDMINPALQYIGETVLPKVTEAFENLWNNVLVPLGSFLMDVLEPIIQVVSEKFSMIWQNVIVPLADTIKNVLSKAFEGMCDIFNNVVIPIVHTVIEVFQFLWDNVLSPIVSFLWDNLKPVFENVFKTVGNIITNIGDIFGGLIDFITGIFCGDWKKAWNGIVDVFKGVFNLIPSIAEGVINGTINLVNNIIHGFNKLTSVVGIPAIPDIPKVELPRLATGGLVYRPTIAQIGEAGKEGVLPLTNKAAMRQLVDEIMISSGAIGVVENGGDFARGIEEAAYRGIMRGIIESGGIKAEATFQVEGDPNKIFTCWQKEYKTRARATQKNLIPIF